MGWGTSAHLPLAGTEPLRSARSDPYVVSVPEAAQMLGITKDLAHDLARRGELLGAFQLGRRWRVSVIRASGRGSRYPGQRSEVPQLVKVPPNVEALGQPLIPMSSSAPAIRRCTSARLGVVTVRRTSAGGVARSAGLDAIIPQLTARPRAACSRACCRRTDAGERPRRESAL